MAFDFKKEYKEFYLPKNTPSIVPVPSMNYIAVRGHGDPNEEDGAYKQAIGLLYGIAFTIKMSKLGDRRIEGYFDYVVPPLEGFWWQDGAQGIDYAHKEAFRWISVIRLPDFVTKADFDWAAEEAARKKKTDFSKVEFFGQNCAKNNRTRTHPWIILIPSRRGGGSNGVAFRNTGGDRLYGKASHG